MSDINKELWNRKNPFIAKILKNKLLSGSSSKKEIRHYEIDLVQSGLAYEVGDTIGIFPLNNLELVEQIICRLKVKPSFIPLGYEDNIFTMSNFSPITAQSVKADAVGKIEQTAHPTHDNAIVRKMKIFKTCVLNDDKKGISEILKQTDDFKNIKNL